MQLKSSKNIVIILYWIILCIILVFCLLVLGAYTRIIGAGLSISYWKPITGLLPPMTHLEWLNEFDIYKQFPEYQQTNFDITIQEFKYIFMVEYLHRMLARLITIFYILPGFYYFFYCKILIHQKNNININFNKEINNINSIFNKNNYFLLKKIRFLYIVISFCILFQGFIGWIMVKSGLYHEPKVNHIKLSLHLFMGILIFCLMYYQSSLLFLNKNHNKNNLFFNQVEQIQKNTDHRYIKYLKYILLIIFFIQIFLGGLMSGLHAGKIYATFPLMGDNIIPLEIVNHGLSLNDPVSVQFLHRIFAFLLLCILSIINYLIIEKHKKFVLFSFFLIFLQITLGIFSIYFYDIQMIRVSHHAVSIFLSCVIIRYYYIV